MTYIGIYVLFRIVKVVIMVDIEMSTKCNVLMIVLYLLKCNSPHNQGVLLLLSHQLVILDLSKDKMEEYEMRFCHNKTLIKVIE